MNAVAEHLTKHGIRPSAQRMAIMEYLLHHRTHPTVDEIYCALHEDMPTLSKTTVYNTLELLSERGAAITLTLDAKNAHFDGFTADHAHFLCEQCGKIYDMELPAGIGPSVTSKDGFKINLTQLSYIGICPECLAKSEK